MRDYKKVLVVVFFFSFLFSCTTSNEVVSNRLFQKRKYQKGWNVNSIKKIDRTKKAETSEYEEKLIAQNEISKGKSVQAEEKLEAKNELVNQEIEDKVISQAVANVLEQHIEIEEKSINESNNDLFIINENQINTNQSDQKEEEFIQKSHNNTEYSMLLMILLCLFLPPVAVGLLRGWSSQEFLISLILFLVGWFGFVLSPLASFAVLAGIVYAFLILFDKI